MSANDTLLPHQSLAPDQALRSRNGRAVLLYQSDGNLVLYVDGRPVWDTQTVGRRPGRAIMQGDGNFVVYDADGAPAWASDTPGHDGAFVTVHDEGTCVIYHGARALLTTGRGPVEPAPPDTGPPPAAQTAAVEAPRPTRPHAGFETVCSDPSVRPGLPPGLEIPPRGAFRFPSPYGTTGIRITSAADGVVLPRNYAYWRQTNNHAGSGTMLVFAGIHGAGPMLFSVDKRRGDVDTIGPLFTDAALQASTGEGLYFSARDPHVVYAVRGPVLLRCDISRRTLTPVFDAADGMHRRVTIWQAHTSADDGTHSATVRDAESGEPLGACVFRERDQRFVFIERRGAYDECQIDKSGRWLVIKENVDNRNGEDNRIIDVETLEERTFLDEAGAAGHSDNGFGYIVGEDNWHAQPAALRVWNLADLAAPPGGALVYHTTAWGAGLGHVSHANAHGSAPPSQQWAWVSNASPQDIPRANEICAVPLDGSLRVVVAAPNLVRLTGELYDDCPKGNCDVTGEYFVWVGSPEDRRDLFMVHLPQR